MAGKKRPSTSTYHKSVQKRAKRQVAYAKRRISDFSQGDKLVKQVSKTLKTVAAKHPDPASRKKIRLALKQLNDAHHAFGNACMCQTSDVYNQGDT